MSLPPETEAEILRLFHGEGWRIGTLARHCGVHRDVIDRILTREGTRLSGPSSSRASMLDAYRSFVIETWKRYPKLSAVRLYRMCKARGYPGGPDHFRHEVAPLRPRPVHEAFLRLRKLPAEEAQVDWGHFGEVTIGRARRRLLAFVMVLSWSRQVFLRFFLGGHMENFLRGHEAAFSAWSGVPRILLYDNLRSVVLERRGDAIRFHPTVLRFAARYRYEPRPVATYRGNEKGRVERSIRFIRTSFWPARHWRDLADLNQQAQAWCDGEAADRPWPEDRRRKVREVFEEEKQKLQSLPADSFVTDEVKEIRVGKTPYVRFDRNDYSVPSSLVRRVLVVRADLTWVQIYSGMVQVASHRRSFDAGEMVEDRDHLKELVDRKREARLGRGQDRLVRAAPEAHELLQSLAARGDNLGSAVARLLDLLDCYGANALRHAIKEALHEDAPHPRSVRHLLLKRLEEETSAPPLPVDLPDDERIRNLSVRPHSLDSYDRLAVPLSEKSSDDVDSLSSPNADPKEDIADAEDQDDSGTLA